MIKKVKKVRTVQRSCFFCESKQDPNYKETSTLEKFITERGKIISRNRSGVCSRHQRALSRAVKQARHLAMLPFVVRI